MAFRSPWQAIAEALPRVGEAIAQGIQLNAQQRAAEAERERLEVRNTKKDYRSQITGLLANRDISEEQRRLLEEQLRLLNSAPDTFVGLESFQNQFQLTAPPVPGERPGLEFLFSPAAMTAEGEIARRAPEAVIAETARGIQETAASREAAQAAYVNLLEAAQDPTVDPAGRTLLVDNFLARGFLDVLEPAQVGILQSLSGYADPVALQTRAAQLRTAEAQATTAEVQADVQVATQAAAIETINANRDLAVVRADVAVRTADFDVDQARVNLEISEQNLEQAAEKHAQELELNEARLTEIKQRTEFAATDQDATNIDVALRTGVDAFLTDEQKRGVADMLGVEFGSVEYDTQMSERRSAVRQAADAELYANSLSGIIADLDVDLREEQIRAAQQQFDIRSYDYDRARVMDPLKDRVAFNTQLAQAVFAGDDFTLRNFLAILENPDINPAQAEALADMGYTVEGLREMTNLASVKRAQLTDDEEARRNLLDAQLTQLKRANAVQAAGIVSNIAGFYPSVESFRQDVPRLRELRYTDAEIEAIEAQVRFKENVIGEDQARQDLILFSSVAPENTQEARAAWRENFVGLAMQSGMENGVAQSLADNYLNAFSVADNERVLRTNELILQSDLLKARIADIGADDTNVGLTTTELLTSMTGHRLVIGAQMEANGCVVPDSLREAIDQATAAGVSLPGVIPRNEQKCSELNGELEALNSAYVSLNGITPESTRPATDNLFNETPPNATGILVPNTPFVVGDVTVNVTLMDAVRAAENSDELTNVLNNIEEQYDTQTAEAVRDAYIAQVQVPAVRESGGTP